MAKTASKVAGADLDNKKSKQSAYTPQRLAGLKPVQPGEVRNPRGRPKGSRNKIAEEYLQDALEAWGKRGKVALDEMATEEPAKFCMMIAGLLPKEIEVKDQLSDLTDAQLDALYEFLDREEGVQAEGREAARPTQGAEPTPALRTLQ